MDGFRPGTDEIFETCRRRPVWTAFDRFWPTVHLLESKPHSARRDADRLFEEESNLSFAQQVEDIPTHEAACRVYP